VVQGRPIERRQGSGAASARSLLLTILGEFVLPQQAPVWTGAVVSALVELGVEEKTARQALSRTAAEDLLVPERHGRRVSWHLTPSATQLLVEGTARIYGAGRQPASWDGQWLVVTLTVPEDQRQLRHRLRTRLTWAGLGSPMSGLWVTPDTSKQSEVTAIIDALGIEAFSFAGSFGELGDVRELVAASWRLEDVERFYASFLKSFAGNKIGTPEQAFRSQVRLVQEWRRVPFLDPGLPAELLPKSWPREAATERFRRRHERWHAPSQTHWRELMATAGDRS
jgi:phenylacetic acid degradation operon negative regulatory protein